MGLMDRYTQDEVTKQKAAAYDKMLKQKEIVDAYNKGGADVSQQAAQMYANDLMAGMAGQAAEQAQRDRMKGDIFAEYSKGNISLDDLARSGQFTREELGQIGGINTDLSNTQDGLAGMSR